MILTTEQVLDLKFNINLENVVGTAQFTECLIRVVEHYEQELKGQQTTIAILQENNYHMFSA